MVDKVFYMPYDPNDPNIMFTKMEYGDTAGGLNKNQIQIDHEINNGKSAVEVWYNGKKDPQISSMGTGQIYIRGHGMPGFISIEGGRGGERIDYQTVAERLKKSGLPKTFQGKIKCFTCHGAESGKVGTDSQIVDGRPFARALADEMYTLGYKNCTYYGYLGAVDSFAKQGSQGMHKYAREVIKGKQVEMGRASDARIQFTPKITFKKRSLFKKVFG